MQYYIFINKPLTYSSTVVYLTNNVATAPVDVEYLVITESIMVPIFINDY